MKWRLLNILHNFWNVGGYYHSFGLMESEKEKTPSNINSAAEQEEKIDSVTSARSTVGHEDSQQASEQTSSATSALSCKAKSAEKPAKNKKPLDGTYYYLKRYKT